MKAVRPWMIVVFLAALAAAISACQGSVGPTRTGTIRVSSDPTGAGVFLDGTDMATVTNCSLTGVAAGSHTIKLVKAGYADYQGAATVTSGQTANFSATLTAVPQIVFVTVDYSRVLPVPNPNGADFPVLDWTYPNYVGNQGLAKVAEHDFTGPKVRLATETVIHMWVMDLKMDNGVTTKVCATIKVNGQLLDVGAALYGEAVFIIGNDGMVRKAV